MIRLLLAALVCVATHGAEPSRPNVILIVTDDQGYGDIAVHGNTMIRTPQMDRLHDESARFTNFHVDPTCSPTRAALLTGRYSTRTGVWHTVMGRSLLAPDETTMADLFRRGGYRTALFGKWHLGDNYPLRPQDRGFEEVLTFGGGGIGQTPDFWGNDYFDDTFLHNGKPESFSGYCTDVFFNQALHFIEANKNRPFFVYLATNVPHSPFNVSDYYSRPYRERGVPTDMANFYGMIENADANLGRLRARLTELGLADNTIFVFMSDNGTAGGVAKPGKDGASGPGWKGFNAGMRGTKGSEYEGGHRDPLFIRWPAGGIDRGRDLRQLTAHIDLLPTLAEFCGLSVPANLALDGTSLVPLLRGDATTWPERTLFAHAQRKEIPPKWTHSAVMTDRWRFVNGVELYDLPADPGEQSDVASTHPDVVAALRQRYESWWTSLAPALARQIRIPLGTLAENPTRLNCMDWHAADGTIPWDQEQVAALPAANGVWKVEIAAAGRYRFTLRHRPAEAPIPLQATIARVRVGEREAKTAIPAGATAVTLDLNLPAGPADLQTFLDDKASGQSRGAFYVGVELLP
ncbi:MAG: arylsulfatase [Lacunisphaera sp.]|nr:arylsulfatase [Lacunisphaera sp.]